MNENENARQGTEEKKEREKRDPREALRRRLAEIREVVKELSEAAEELAAMEKEEPTLWQCHAAERQADRISWRGARAGALAHDAAYEIWCLHELDADPEFAAKMGLCRGGGAEGAEASDAPVGGGAR